MKKVTLLDSRVVYNKSINLKSGFYVYSFADQNGDIFYIGKGKQQRFKQHFLDYRLKHNSPKNSKIKSILSKGFKVNVEIIAKSLLEFEALTLEKKLIEYYGLKEDGGSLYNLRYGSYDSAGLWTDSRKRKHSLKLRGNGAKFTPEQVKKAKLLVHYRGYSYSDVCKLVEFKECKTGTIHSWCAGNNFKYVSPHLKTMREIVSEKREEVINLWKKGQFNKKQISDILGINYPSVIQYIKEAESKELGDASSKNV